MNGHHSSKSISFLMELIFVLFFFTIASAVAVFVVSGAKEKNDYAIDARNAIFYGENLIETQSTYLKEDQFYIDKNGKPSNKEGYYKVQIVRKDINDITKQTCTLEITKANKHLVTLSFLYEGGGAS